MGNTTTINFTNPNNSTAIVAERFTDVVALVELRGRMLGAVPSNLKAAVAVVQAHDPETLGCGVVAFAGDGTALVFDGGPGMGSARFIATRGALRHFAAAERDACNTWAC